MSLKHLQEKMNIHELVHMLSKIELKIESLEATIKLQRDEYEAKISTLEDNIETLTKKIETINHYEFKPISVFEEIGLREKIPIPYKFKDNECNSDTARATSKLKNTLEITPEDIEITNAYLFGERLPSSLARRFSTNQDKFEFFGDEMLRFNTFHNQENDDDSLTYSTHSSMPDLVSIDSEGDGESESIN